MSARARKALALLLGSADVAQPLTAHVVRCLAAENTRSPHRPCGHERRSARRAGRRLALGRTGVAAVAIATPDLTVLLVDDVLGPLTPSGLSSSGLRSRLRWKDLAAPGAALAAVGPAPAV